MFALGNVTFACGVRSTRERSFEEASSETEVGRRRWRCGHTPSMQTNKLNQRSFFDAFYFHSTETVRRERHAS